MGLFSRLFGSKPSFTDRIFLRHAYKLRDFRSQVAADTGSGRPLVVVYHFEETARWIRDALDADAIAHADVRRPSAAAAMDLPSSAGPNTVPLLASEELPSLLDLVRGETPRAGTSPARLHLAEHFPVPPRDDDVLSLHDVLPAKSEFVAYVSLDEPWLAPLVTDEVSRLMQELGLQEDECLSHSMIGSSLRRAQEQLALKTHSLVRPAESCRDWMLANVDARS